MAVTCSRQFLTMWAWFRSHISPCVICGGQSDTRKDLSPSNVELHLSGLIGTENHPDLKKTRIIGFFFENMLYWQFKVRRLIFTVCTFI